MVVKYGEIYVDVNHNRASGNFLYESTENHCASNMHHPAISYFHKLLMITAAAIVTAKCIQTASHHPNRLYKLAHLPHKTE